MRVPLRSEIAARGLTLIRREVYRLGADQVTAVLCRDPAAGGWVIGLTGRGGRCFCALPTDAAEAETLFDKIVRHTVSPCTLRDVIEDGLPAPEPR